ncbi:hypothetical protein BDV18DRAFT_21589 [Aspergillus unguis]
MPFAYQHELQPRSELRAFLKIEDDSVLLSLLLFCESLIYANVLAICYDVRISIQIMSGSPKKVTRSSKRPA